MFCLKFLPISKQNHHNQALVFGARLHHLKWGRQDTTKGKTKINVRHQRQTGHARHSKNRTKGIHEYKRGQRRPKWKAPRGPIPNAQAQATRGGEEVKREVEGQEEPLKKKVWKA
jgi:hypothetical protein